jgi:hypothetical protein
MNEFDVVLVDHHGHFPHLKPHIFAEIHVSLFKPSEVGQDTLTRIYFTPIILLDGQFHELT